jgi:hypothetical protein
MALHFLDGESEIGSGVGFWGDLDLGVGLGSSEFPASTGIEFTRRGGNAEYRSWLGPDGEWQLL